MEENLAIAAVVVLGLILLAATILGAINLFAYAGRQGFVGLAAYVACWVFLAPVIGTISALFGLYLFFLIIKNKFE